MLGPGVALLHVQPSLLRNGEPDNEVASNIVRNCGQLDEEGERKRPCTRGLRASWMGLSSPMTRSATDSRRALRRLLPFSDIRFFLCSDEWYSN
jgi:hypothetical protein